MVQGSSRPAAAIVSLLTALAVAMVLRTPGPAVRSRPGALLLWSTIVVAAGALALPFLGPVSGLFGFVPLPLAIAATAVGIVIACMYSTEAAKARFHRRLDA